MINDATPPSVLEFPNAPYDLDAAMKAHDAYLLRSLQVCFPACVYSYDRSSHTAQVMPLVKQGVFNKEWMYFRRTPFTVSVRNIQCGGFTFDYPLYVGDTGWVFASDRDTLLLKSEGAFTHSVLEGDRPLDIVENDYQQNPATHELHKLIHGFFIPDNWGNWEFGRYKDNPGLAVGNSLYIGSSIDTKDLIQKSGAQKGDKYEEKITSSLVIQPSGGVHISSSSSKTESQNVHVSVVKNTVDATATDSSTGITSSMKLSADDGIYLQQSVIPPQEDKPAKENNKQHQQFTLHAKGGDFLLRARDGLKTVNISFSKGSISISSSDDINIIAQKGLNANVMGNAQISADKVRVAAVTEAAVTAPLVEVAAQKSVNVNAAETVNIGAVKSTNINAGETVNLAAGKTINVTAPESVNLVTASDMTIMAKKESAKIGISTLSKGATINIGGEGEETQVHVNVPKGYADITCKNTIVTAEEYIQIQSPETEISGNVMVTGQVEVGSLTIGGSPVEKKSHGEQEGAEYWG